MATVNATEDTITVKVDCKHISGNDAGGAYGGPLFLISTRNYESSYSYIESDYIVSCDDYYKINVGDTVTLKPEGRLCHVVNINGGSVSGSWW